MAGQLTEVRERLREFLESLRSDAWELSFEVGRLVDYVSDLRTELDNVESTLFEVSETLEGQGLPPIETSALQSAFRCLVDFEGAVSDVESSFSEYADQIGQCTELLEPNDEKGG